jgi:hypothetical protein
MTQLHTLEVCYVMFPCELQRQEQVQASRSCECWLALFCFTYTLHMCLATYC